METKQTVEKMKKIKGDLRYDGMLVVPCVRRIGGLAMLWKSEVLLDIQTYSLNHIDDHILNNPSSSWRLTGFYGRPEKYQKHESWSYLCRLHSRASLSWVCVGDYNEILTSDEKQGGSPRAGRLMEDLLHCGLIDLGFSGNKYTWRNGRPGDAFVQERLDRACATVEWRELFPHSKVTHLHAAYLDHVPILLTTQGATHSTRGEKIPKRFEEKWASHPECEQIIMEAWNGTNPTGSPMFRLFEKIKKCCMALVGWSRNMGSLKEHIDEKYMELEALTEMNNAENIGQINRVRDENNALLLQDEFFWRQRSRQSGYQLVIKTQNTFTKGQTKEEGRIRSLVSRMRMEDGAPQTMRLLGWLNHISKIYSHQPTRVIWSLYWRRWIGWSPQI